MKKINKITFRLLVLFTSISINGDGTKVDRQPCISPLVNTNFNVIGDSRAELFWFEQGIEETKETIYRKGNALVTANIGGKFIFPLNEISVGNRAVSGSHSSGWKDQVDNCKAHNLPFEVANRSMVIMGGNDILVFYKEKSKYQEQYNLQYPAAPKGLLSFLGQLITARFQALRKLSVASFISHPIQAFQTLFDNFLVFINPVLAIQYELGKSASRSVLRGKQRFSLNFVSFWDWQTGSKTDEVVANTDVVIRHILNQSPDHRVLMNTEYPVAWRPLLIFGFLNNDFRQYPGLLKVFLDLRMKFRQRLFPTLMKAYPGRAIPLDLYDQFMHSIIAGSIPGSLFDGANGELSPDGIHPSPTGNKFWGQQMAIIMARLKWFNTTPGLDLSRAVFYGDAELDSSSSVIDIKAMEMGISDNEILKAPLIKIMGGYKKDFIGRNTSIYNKKGDDSAYPVAGLHLARYMQEGETGGRLGFPTGDMYGEVHDTIASQNFECGKIYDNHLDFIEHFHTQINSNECPTPEVE